MNRARKISVGIGALAVFLSVLALLIIRWHARRPVLLKGAVMVQSSDTHKELPISDVEVTADLAQGPTRSDSTGFFELKLRPFIRRGEPLALHFRKSLYRPLDVKDFVGDKLYIVYMVPVSTGAPPSNRPLVKVSNVRVRYSIQAMTELNVGSAVRTFQVENKGNVPCKGHRPCSPDGKWRAAIASASLNAGPGNEFQNARASCIAGPCPFTKIETDHFSQGGQTITVSARDWSDTATFLLEAEVFHRMVSQVVHESYPVIFGQTLNFILPSNAEGVCFEADMDGQTIIFPIGPVLFLNWATCNARVNPDQTQVYRCELKPGYRFK
ncbi:MAG TPA: hypothetical protein VMU61_06530 [Candidatus Aquilonibacter sp.]|nr:hypothetical protein [Candidatus Aquilonibacter sp.]